jgi:hypothetical protein
MTIELPVLRLGLAGFSAEQQEELAAMLHGVTSGSWQVGKFAAADAWWLNGARIQVLPDSTIRVASGEPGGRSLHLDLEDVDRPVAFTLPLAPRYFEPLYTFEAGSTQRVAAILEKFEAWLRPLIAQFCLASWIIEQESVLGRGVHHLLANGVLIAVVNMRGEVGVLPTAGPVDFENASLHCVPSPDNAIPDHLVRSSLSQLMWQFAVRTTRDLLPKRYLTGLVLYRRPPRLPHRMLTDSHLLLLRELAAAPGRFETLQQRTGLGAAALAHELAALYLVGAITTDPKRAAPVSPLRRSADADSDSAPSQQQSVIFSGLDSGSQGIHPGGKTAPGADLTAPVPLRPR